jgi:hypothetical protein
MDWNNGRPSNGLVNQEMSDTGIEEGSLHWYMHLTAGETVSKEITLAGNAGPESVNIFKLTGTVEIISIHGFITDATTLANLTGAHLELWDSTAAIDLTKNDGVLSGMGVGTLLAKNATASTTIAIADNSVGAFTEGATVTRAYADFFLTQKAGADTYVRFTYATTDAPIDAKIYWHAQYRPEEHNDVQGTLVAV